ncbi:MAG: DUF2326 domain-containing protein [Leuconostoc mesenteroides]
MFIKNLTIINTSKDVVIRNIDFHNGANFIVDTQESTQHNKVGKTTFLKLIDVALGANDKKLIYVDSETNSIEEELRDLIINEKMAVELILVDKLEHWKTEVYTLHVDLFPRGNYKINGEKVNQTTYRQKLNEILFQNSKQTPSFRQLIKSFVRISLSGDNNTFLRNLPRTSNNDYRAVYNYLFDISDPSIDYTRGQLKKQLIALDNAEKQYKRVQNSKEPAEIEQVISVLQNDKKDIQSKLNDIISSDEFQKNRNNVSNIRQQYASFSAKLSDAKFKQQQNRLMIEQLIKDDKLSVNKSVTADFFNEINEIIPNINKTFNDLVNFNNKLQKNKIIYLQEVQSTLDANVELISKKRDELVQGNEALISLVAKNRLDEYNKLLQNLSEREQEISTRQQMLTAMKNFATDRNRIESEIKELDESHDKDSSDYYMTKMDKFNKIFTEFSSQINGERPVLIYNPNENNFPVSITDLDGTSTGTRKSLIASYDLAYQQFAKESNLIVPNFVIHDVLETIEGENLQNIISIANNLESQFIVAILKEKLDSANLSEEEQSRLGLIALSTDDKLFEPEHLPTQQKKDFENQKTHSPSHSNNIIRFLDAI